MKTYWEDEQRGFQNEYSIGVATTAAAADDYKSQGYVKLTRQLALRRLAYKGDAATKAYVGASIDGRQCYKDEALRFIRTGQRY